MKTDTPPLILSYQVYSDTGKPLVLNSQGKVDIQVAKNTTIKCEKIVLKIPQGCDPNCLFKENTVTLSPPDPAYWSVGQSQVIHDDELDIDYKQWTLTNKDAQHLVTHGASCSVSGTVNDKAGTAQIVIKERTEAPGDTSYQLRSGKFPIDKAGEPAFFLQNLIAIDPLNSGYPCGAIQQGYAVEIRWDSNGTSFELYQSGITAPIYSGKATSYTLNNGITDTTTFSCVASDSNGSKLVESFTLTVISPILTPNAVTTNNDEDVTGEMTTDKATCNTLNLSSNTITMTGTDPNVDNITDSTSSIDLSGTFSVDDNGDISNFIETLQCTDISADSLSIQDSIDFTHQQLPIFGAFEPLASGSNISLASKKVNTDGYAIIAVDVSSDDNSVAYGALSFDNNNWFSTYGANDNQNPVHGFLWLPVPAGTTWYYKGENLTSVSNPATISVFWVPMGKDTPSAQQGKAVHPVADSSSHTNDPRQLFEQYAATKKQRQTNLISSIETLLDTEFDVATKEEMYRQLMTLQNIHPQLI